MTVRFRIHANKSATLAGVDYQDLRSVFDGAAIQNYNDLRRLREKEKLSVDDHENLAWIEHQIKVLDTIKLAVDAALAASFGTKRTPPTKAERLKAVRQERHERVLIDSLLDL